MGILPFFRLSAEKVLIGTSVKDIKALSDRLLIIMGGGSVPIEEYWRQMAV